MNPIILKLEDHYDDDSGRWQWKSKVETTYDDYLNILEQSEWVWSDSVNAWSINERMRYAYNDTGRVTRYTRESLDHGIFGLTEEDVYNDRGDYIEEIHTTYRPSVPGGLTQFIRHTDKKTGKLLYSETRLIWTSYSEWVRCNFVPVGQDTINSICEEYDFESETWTVTGIGFSTEVYDDDGCLVMEETSSPSGYGRILNYVNDAQCRPIQIVELEREADSMAWYVIRIDSIAYDLDTVTTFTRFNYAMTPGPPKAITYITKELIVSDRREWLYIWSLNPLDDSLEVESTRELDQFGQESYAYTHIRYPDSDWRPVSENITQRIARDTPVYMLRRNEYMEDLEDWLWSREEWWTYNENDYVNTNDFIIRNGYQDPGSPVITEQHSEFDYTYYCNSLAREEMEVTNGELTRRRYSYYYPVDCSQSNPNQIKVYPNPTDGRLIVESNLATENGIAMRVIAPDGRVVADLKLNELNGFLEADLTGRPEGVYILYLNQPETGLSQVTRIVKMK